MAVSVESSTTNADTSNTETHTCTLAATIGAGSELIEIFGVDGGTAPSGIGAGWTLDTDHSAGGCGLHVATKDSVSGSEDGGSVVISTTSNTQQSARASISLTGNEGTIEYSSGASGNSTGPDSASITPSWGAEAGTMIISAFCQNEGDATVTTIPSGYTAGGEIGSSGGAGVMIAWAYKIINATSEDPGAWLTDTSEAWNATTIAIRATTAISLSLDDTSPEPGVQFKATAGSALPSGAITVGTFGNNSNTLSPDVSPAATDTIAYFTPALADFVAGGALAKVRWDVADTFKVGNGTEETDTTAIQIDHPASSGTPSDQENLFTTSDGTTVSTNSDSLSPSGVASGDDLFLEGDDLVALYANGVPEVSDVGGSGNFRWFDVSGMVWSTIVNHPWTGVGTQRINIIPRYYRQLMAGSSN